MGGGERTREKKKREKKKFNRTANNSKYCSWLRITDILPLLLQNITASHLCPAPAVILSALQDIYPPLLSMCSPCSSWTMAVWVAGTMTMLPSSRPHTSRPWAGMYTLAVTLRGSLMFGIKLSWSIIPAGRGVSLSKASWRDTEVVVCRPVHMEKI